MGRWKKINIILMIIATAIPIPLRRRNTSDINRANGVFDASFINIGMPKTGTRLDG